MAIEVSRGRAGVGSDPVAELRARAGAESRGARAELRAMAGQLKIAIGGSPGWAVANGLESDCLVKDSRSESLELLNFTVKSGKGLDIQEVVRGSGGSIVFIDPEFAQGSKLTEADRYPKSETEAAELLKNAKTTEERQRIFKLLIGKVKLPINTKLVTEGSSSVGAPLKSIILAYPLYRTRLPDLIVYSACCS
ncbi:hypothetical protein BY996DRAFT_6474167 [Phakopsora pachyrhizi]|nr:hypothetical protein BY996DRAFT_6474167 [Phakopsora pachyrhizi]